jgi:hypothetical protein
MEQSIIEVISKDREIEEIHEIEKQNQRENKERWKGKSARDRKRKRTGRKIQEKLSNRSWTRLVQDNS